jgi:hypothetical protein
MTKTKYEVHTQSGITVTYVTQKRNAEDMIMNIIDKHQRFDEFGEPRYLKVVQVINGESKIIYTPKMYKFFTNNLVVS